MEALVRLAQGHSMLRVALELGFTVSPAPLTMFRRVMGRRLQRHFIPGLIGGAGYRASLQRGARATSLSSIPTPQWRFSLRKTGVDTEPASCCWRARREALLAR